MNSHIYGSHAPSLGHFGTWLSNTEETHRQLLWLGSGVVRSRTAELLLNWSLSKRVKKLSPLRNTHTEAVLLTCPLGPCRALLMTPHHLHPPPPPPQTVTSLQVTPHQGEFAGRGLCAWPSREPIWWV